MESDLQNSVLINQGTGGRFFNKSSKLTGLRSSCSCSCFFHFYSGMIVILLNTGLLEVALVWGGQNGLARVVVSRGGGRRKKPKTKPQRWQHADGRREPSRSPDEERIPAGWGWHAVRRDGLAERARQSGGGATASLSACVHAGICPLAGRAASLTSIVPQCVACDDANLICKP